MARQKKLALKTAVRPSRVSTGHARRSHPVASPRGSAPHATSPIVEPVRHPSTPQRLRQQGRPRSDAARAAILKATLKLLETQSVQAISIEAIAKEAGVGKATIYRWWPSKASVVIDAFVQNHVVHTPMPRGVSCREALAQHLRLLIEQYGGWGGRIVTQILAEGQANPDVLREFRERFMLGRQAVVRETLDEARRRGELTAAIDIDLQMDVLYAPIYMRLITGHAPLDRRFADTYPDAALALFATAGAPEPVPAKTRSSKGS